VVHKKLLCEKSEVFDKMFNGSFKEATSNTATLSDDDPEAFEALVEWLYQNTFTIGDCEDNDIRIAMLHPVVATAVLGLKYSIPELVDRATTRYVSIAKHLPDIVAILNAKTVYESTPACSKLRKLLAGSLAYHILKNPARGERPEFEKRLVDDLRTTDGLLEDVMPLLRGMAGKFPKDPLLVSSCEYHEHPPAQRCPNKKRKHSVD
jgi:BTB/POZ domain